MSLWFVAFRLIPKNLMSFVVGYLARLRLPRPLSSVLRKTFVGFYKINMSEAERELASYATIEDVFTRALKPGVRTFSRPYASPADGTLVRSATLRHGEALQAKDWWYKAEELIFGEPELLTGDLRRVHDFSFYTTVYLAPHNYHRVHTPFSAHLTSVRYLPGRLWPVNERFVGLVPGLFVENERLTFDFELAGGAKAWVVMVGALNVGRMRTPFVPGFHSNACLRPPLAKVVEYPMATPLAVKLGDELGTFMLGSTVIVILNKAAESLLKPKSIEASQTVVLGQCLSQE